MIMQVYEPDGVGMVLCLVILGQDARVQVLASVVTCPWPSMPAQVAPRTPLASGTGELRRQVAQCPGSLGSTGWLSPRTGCCGSSGPAHPF